MKDILKKGFEALKIEYDEIMLDRFKLYYELLIDYNKKVNLTAITEKNDVAVKHFLDSVSLLGVCDVDKDVRMIDVGTGAGFPGLPLKIARGDIKLTLADSLNKRVEFLKLCVNELGLLDVECIHSRAEELAHKQEHREMYDFAVSRAVANMATLSEYCIPFLKVGAKFAAFKGPSANDELALAKNAIATLGGANACIKAVNIADYDLSHSIILVDKITNTAPKYPRSGNKPLNKPI
ncbi:MAG: 16S rRNA (guanine(527)-N(7))-methyltransferase RsmG [Ruminococcaceae bacterium]|nr:16S rRNA (guanine(527)-N(7))-methyltransferase RsmG [Oscillospiraceae bacterium]